MINTQDKRAHNNYNMITCMKNSLTSDLQDTMDTEFESYTLGDTEVAALFLLALIKHAEPGTHATVALVRADLTRLDEKMLELDSNIQAFNEYVRKQKRKLTNRREQISDLLINLFKGYSAARDEKFALTISNIEEDYLHGKLPTLTDEILMSDAYKAYKVRVEKRIWGALGEDKETIIAMQAEIAELKDKRLKLDTKSGTKKKKKVTSPKKKQQSAYAWKDSNSQNKKTLMKDGKKYYWCLNHNNGKGKWVIHKPTECRNEGAGATDHTE